MIDDPDPKPTGGAPTGAPQLRRKDTRQSLTLKGDFTPELRALIARAARASGQTQAAFITAALTSAAQRILKGEPLDPGAAQATPPAVVDEALATAVFDKVMVALEAKDRARTLDRNGLQRAWDAFWKR